MGGTHQATVVSFATYDSRNFWRRFPVPDLCSDFVCYMSFAIGFGCDWGVGVGKSGSLGGGGQNGRNCWGNVGILEDRCLGRNTLGEGAVEFGTSRISVSLPRASLPLKIGLNSQMQS